MTCIEILQNGKRLCVVGHEKVASMLVVLVYNKHGNKFGLVPSASVQSTPELVEERVWLKEEPTIGVGDTIELRIADDLVPEPGHLRYSHPRYDKGTRFCSFCGTSQLEASHLIAGPSTITQDGVKHLCICDRCIRKCSGLIGEEGDSRDARAP